MLTIFSISMQAAEYAAENLHNYIFKHPLFKSDCQRAVSDACDKVDREFVEFARSSKDVCDGTTAVLALLIKSRVIIATIGDSYCVRLLRMHV